MDKSQFMPSKILIASPILCRFSLEVEGERRSQDTACSLRGPSAGEGQPELWWLPGGSSLGDDSGPVPAVSPCCVLQGWLSLQGLGSSSCGEGSQMGPPRPPAGRTGQETARQPWGWFGDSLGTALGADWGRPWGWLGDNLGDSLGTALSPISLPSPGDGFGTAPGTAWGQLGDSPGDRLGTTLGTAWGQS